MLSFDFLIKEKKKIFFIFLFLLLIEMFSFVSFNFSFLNTLLFFLILTVFSVVAFYNLKWSLYLFLAEVFLNSMGYLFYFELSGFKISLRISLWLILMAIFLGKFLLKFIKDKKGTLKMFQSLIFKNNFLYLSFFIIFAFLFGLARNGFGDAFLDFNSWLYFLIVLPFFYVVYDLKEEEKQKFWQNIVLIFLSVSLFICFKSLLFLFAFSHDLRPIISDLYSWSRLYLLGEITNMNEGFYRIFLQNQIFILIAFFFTFLNAFFNESKKGKIYSLLLSSVFLSVIILSFSRSFWLGVLTALACLSVIIWHKFKFKKALHLFGLGFLSFFIAVLLVFAIVKFPWPNIKTEFNIDSLSERANISGSESAISSRWALLEVMKSDIRSNFLLGRGFGARLEYVSSDPRVLQSSPDGKYSTYAFEWSWLDILLKMGFFGLLVYLYLIFLVLKKSIIYFYKNNSLICLGIFLSLISLIAVNFFTPYLNHPLGISCLILLIFLLSFETEKTSK